MTVVYDLWFEREYPDREDTELHIGIYATEAEAAEQYRLAQARKIIRLYCEWKADQN